jgi:hypothetical protein
MGNQTTQPAPVKKSSAMYMGMRLSDESQQAIDEILADLGIETKTTYVNHHVTIVFNPSWHHCAFAGLNACAAVTGILVSDDHVVIQVGEVEVESWPGVYQKVRPVMDLVSDVTNKGRKGQRYHVTHSLREGAKAKDSNLLLTGEVKSERYVEGVEGIGLIGQLYWANAKGEEFDSLDNLKKCPELQVGAARTIFTGIGSYHSGDGGYDFLGSFSQDIRQGLEIAVPFGRPGCGRWSMSKAAAECVRVGMVRPKGREVSWTNHRDDVMPTVPYSEVSEKVSPETSSVITFSLSMMLLDPDDERELGAEAAREEKVRLIRSNCRLFAIAVIANGEDAPGAPPPSVHRCQQKIANGEPLPEGELARAQSYWYVEHTNPQGWVLVDYRNSDED